MKTVWKRDPHREYPANLSKEDWSMFRKDSEVLEMVETIKEIINLGLVAKISNEVLCELQFLTMARNNHKYLRLEYTSWSWSNLVNVLNMLCHTRSETDIDDRGFTRFSKSPIDLPPIWDEHAVYVPCPQKSWWHWVRKDEVKTARSSGLRQNNSIDGISGTGTRVWDKAGQGFLFNVH